MLIFSFLSLSLYLNKVGVFLIDISNETRVCACEFLSIIK